MTAPSATIHRHVGDPVLLLVPVANLAANDTLIAEFAVDGVTPVGKTRGAGVEVVSGAQARLDYPSDCRPEPG